MEWLVLLGVAGAFFSLLSACARKVCFLSFLPLLLSPCVLVAVEAGAGGDGGEPELDGGDAGVGEGGGGGGAR